MLKYLARYTHRVAFSNTRLVRLANDQVTFTYKDYADDCRHKEMTLPAVEFLRRFALHVIPGRLVRTRQYGLLSNRGRKERLAQCRQLLSAATSEPAAATASPEPQTPPWTSSFLAVLIPLLVAGLPPLPSAPISAPSPQAPRCRRCGMGRLHFLWQAPRVGSRDLPDLASWQRDPPGGRIPDTS